MDQITARILRCNPTRCDQCGGRLERFDDETCSELYCPDCVAFRPTYAATCDDVIDLGRDDDLIDLAREDV
jgi:late competence protein required for DNA uptake (superfamily II DNA/RNA helicase)